MVMRALSCSSSSTNFICRPLTYAVRQARIRQRGKLDVPASSIIAGDHDMHDMSMSPPTARSQSLDRPANDDTGVHSTPIQKQLGFVSADTPSIALIRQEMELLRREKQATEYAARVALSNRQSGSTEGQISSAPRREHLEKNNLALSPLAVPSYNASDSSLRQGAAAREYLVRQRLLADATDVLRKRKASDGVRLATMFLKGSASLHDKKAKRESIAELLCAIEKKLVDGLHAAEVDKMKADSVFDKVDDMVLDAAVLQVIVDADDTTVQRWLQFGIVDPVWWLDDDSVKAASAEDSEENEGAALHPIRALFAYASVGEFIAEAQGSAFLKGIPSEDVAAIVLKARKGDYASITEKEIQKLEAYEASMKQPETRALAANSPLLAAVAERDPQVRAALEPLDRAKRHAALDKEFQAALEYVHALEKAQFQAIERVRPKPRKSSLEVPFFFGNPASKPPPAADMNLPDKALSAKEKGIIRRQKRLRMLKQRYGQ